jgi:hypothetical protein
MINNPFPVPVSAPVAANPGANGSDGIASALPSFAARRVVQAGPSSRQQANAVRPPPPDYRPRMDFALVPELAVKRYQKQMKLEAGDDAGLVARANAAFQTAPVDEKESISFFIYKCKNAGIANISRPTRRCLVSSGKICVAGRKRRVAAQIYL